MSKKKLTDKQKIKMLVALIKAFDRFNEIEISEDVSNQADYIEAKEHYEHCRDEAERWELLSE